MSSYTNEAELVEQIKKMEVEHAWMIEKLESEKQAEKEAMQTKLNTSPRDRHWRPSSCKVQL